MNSFARKFELILVPFLKIAVATIFIVTLLNWLLFIRFSLFTVDDIIINLIVPMVAPGIPLLIWLRPRLKMLNFKKRRSGDPLSGYMMLAWVALIVPTAVAQSYLATATGTLTKLNDISQINDLPKTKYYSASHYFIDKKLVRVKPKFSVSGKYNDQFDMAIYAPCPIFDKDHAIAGNDNPDSANVVSGLKLNGKKPLVVFNGTIISLSMLSRVDPRSIVSVDVLKDASATALYGSAAHDGAILITSKTSSATLLSGARSDPNSEFTPIAWLAVKYNKTISNHLSPQEKEAAYKQFATESQATFESASFGNAVYFERLNLSSDVKNYVAAIKAKNDTLSGPFIILEPVNESFESRNGQKLPWIFGSLTIGSLVFLIMLLFTPLKNEDQIIDDSMKDKSDTSSFLSELKIFIPSPGYYVTPILIDLNLLIFIGMVITGLGFISFESVDLLKLGANFKPLITQGEYWRLLTNMFLHGGVMHVLFNMYGLLFVGIFLEPVIGSKRFAVTYITTGIIASITSVWWHADTVSVGASGAIFGMYGIFLALLTTNLFQAGFKKSFLISTGLFVGYNLLFGLTGGIDNAAHIGGLLSGLVIGYMLYPTLKNRTRQTEAHTPKFLDDLKSDKADADSK